ncbi:hypothetical protein PSACC_00959 [Paramicrosporidium saccamoebae]|uniref:Uncharacterized protein n=1 Tax=Paramicrosporidium saccamoebae TaxID=1246581 RepID=A0A2H9TNA3_9FUNG|nr:hypothetical protein PSACC_00959 [Paramicrosporidium saccamoebae]
MRSPTPGLLASNRLPTGMTITHILTRSTIKIVFDNERIDYIESGPRGRATYKVYHLEESRCQDGYCTAYWILGLLPSRKTTIPVFDWLKRTKFNDSNQGELEAWVNARLNVDHYTVFIIDVQVPSVDNLFTEEGSTFFDSSDLGMEKMVGTLWNRLQTKTMNLKFLLAIILGLTVAVKIRVLSPTRELLQTELTVRSVKITQMLTKAYIHVTFKMNRIYELDIHPLERILYKLYGYNKDPLGRPRASGVIGDFVSIYWMIVLLPAKLESQDPDDWLALTGFSDANQEAFEQWYNYRSTEDDYTVVIIDVQVPEWRTFEDSKDLPILDMPKSVREADVGADQ